MQNLIYIVEDETDILELISLTMLGAGFSTRCFERAAPMFQALEMDLPHLIILDLMLPDQDGMEVCKALKANPSFEKIPILMLTARTDIEDKVKGLEYGADDYVSKPFNGKELVARVKAILRRARWETDKNVLIIGHDFKLDFNRYEAFLKGKRVDLTLTEFKILQLLTKRPGWVYSRSQILDYLWGNDKIVIERTIDVHIKNLRDKIGDYNVYIKNIRGVGYKFELSEDTP